MALKILEIRVLQKGNIKLLSATYVCATPAVQLHAHIAGLVLGLGSRLKQKGVALTSGDYHMTSRGLQRKTSVKRKTRSHEDLLLPNKRCGHYV